MENKGGYDDDPFDNFITKFLRSQKGFQMLVNEKWLDMKLENWIQRGGMDYVNKLEANTYEGLNMSKLNSLVQTHAMSIWLPIYEHSSDLRSEIQTIKKFPF